MTARVAFILRTQKGGREARLKLQALQSSLSLEKLGQEGIFVFPRVLPGLDPLYGLPVAHHISGSYQHGLHHPSESYQNRSCNQKLRRRGQHTNSGIFLHFIVILQAVEALTIQNKSNNIPIKNNISSNPSVHQ